MLRQTIQLVTEWTGFLVIFAFGNLLDNLPPSPESICRAGSLLFVLAFQNFGTNRRQRVGDNQSTPRLVNTLEHEA